MKLTINQALVYQKIVRERVNELKGLRSEVSKRESYLYARDEKRVVEPQYDVKAVDKKITELETFLLKTDMAIKQSNAVTEIDGEFNTDELLKPLQ